jgi:SAM-dependent methyltransferase
MPTQPSAEVLLRGRSERLRAFVQEAPLERTSILAFVVEQAQALPPDSRVLDIGADEAPYRELFSAHRYTTLNGGGPLPESRDLECAGRAESIPAPDGSFDAVLCIQVLEHLPNPLGALREFRRVLGPGGALIATVPFASPEHQLPPDYNRYSKRGIEHLVTAAGFTELEVRPCSDCFTTIAQLARNAVPTAGTASDGLDALRREAHGVLQKLSEALVRLAPLDVDMRLPLGYSVLARVPQAGR